MSRANRVLNQLIMAAAVQTVSRSIALTFCVTIALRTSVVLTMVGAVHPACQTIVFARVFIDPFVMIMVMFMVIDAKRSVSA